MVSLEFAAGMFKLKEDLEAILKSEALLIDVAKRQGAVANMEKPATHLVDAALRMGAKIVSVDVEKTPVSCKKVLTKNKNIDTI